MKKLEVLRELDSVGETLATVYNYHAKRDEAKAHLRMRSDLDYSPLTTALNDALNILFDVRDSILDEGVTE